MEPAAIQNACWRNQPQPANCDTWLEWQRRAQEDWGISPEQFNNEETGYVISTPQERYLEFAARFSAPQGAEKYKALNLCLLRAVRADNVEDASYFLELEANNYSGAIYEATRKGHSGLVRVIQEYMENEETIRSSLAEGYGERGILPRGLAPPTQQPTLPTATLPSQQTATPSLPGLELPATMQSIPNVAVLVGAARGSQLKLFTYLLTTLTIEDPQAVLLAALVGWSEAEIDDIGNAYPGEQPRTLLGTGLPKEIQSFITPVSTSANVSPSPVGTQLGATPRLDTELVAASGESLTTENVSNSNEVDNHLAIGRFLLTSLAPSVGEEEMINWEPIAYNLGLHHNEVGLNLLLTQQSSRLRLEYFWGQVAANDMARLKILLESWPDTLVWIETDPDRWSYEIGKGGVWDLVEDQRIDWNQLLKGAATGGHIDLIMLARERAVILAETIFDAISNSDQAGYDDIADALSELVPQLDEP